MKSGDPAGGIEPQAEDRVCDEALQSRSGGARRAAGGDASTHAGLHQQEGRRHGADPDQKCGADRRLAHPLESPHGKQQASERDTDDVVGNPTDASLAPHGGGCCDRRMVKATARSLIGLVPQEMHIDIFETVWAVTTYSRGLFGLPPNNALVEQVLRDLSLW